MVANKCRYSFKQRNWVAVGLGRFVFRFYLQFRSLYWQEGETCFGLGMWSPINVYIYIKRLKTFVNNFYPSVHLFKYLLSQGMSSCGTITIIAGRKDFQYTLGISNRGENERGLLGQ